MDKKTFIKIGSILTGIGLILFLASSPLENLFAIVGIGLILFGVVAINISEWVMQNGFTRKDSG